LLPGGPAAEAAGGTSRVEVRTRATLEDLMPALVRRVAWSGNAQSGAVVLELGAGALAGARVLVQADGGRVRVELSGPPGLDLTEWRERIGARLAARGLSVEPSSRG
jgi:hypothetical protein